MLDDILDETQVAHLLGCAPATVQEKALLGILPAVKFGRSWRFPREALLKVLNEQALANMNPKPRPAPIAIATDQPRSGRRRRQTLPLVAIQGEPPTPRHPSDA